MIKPMADTSELKTNMSKFGMDQFDWRGPREFRGGTLHLRKWAFLFQMNMQIDVLPCWHWQCHIGIETRTICLQLISSAYMILEFSCCDLFSVRFCWIFIRIYSFPEIEKVFSGLFPSISIATCTILFCHKNASMCSSREDMLQVTLGRWPTAHRAQNSLAKSADTKAQENDRSTAAAPNCNQRPSPRRRPAIAGIGAMDHTSTWWIPQRLLRAPLRAMGYSHRSGTGSDQGLHSVAPSGWPSPSRYRSSSPSSSGSLGSRLVVSRPLHRSPCPPPAASSPPVSRYSLPDLFP
jgi:hypothetical protein